MIVKPQDELVARDGVSSGRENPNRQPRSRVAVPLTMTGVVTQISEAETSVSRLHWMQDLGRHTVNPF